MHNADDGDIIVVFSQWFDAIRLHYLACFSKYLDYER
jgi:hypothetical protein